MSDRVRTGEILAAIGAVGLAVLLAFGAWFSYDVVLPGGSFSVTGAVGARHLGWFALLFTFLAAVAGLMFLARALTSVTSDRPVLQAPIAFTAALFALIVDLVRMLLFTPSVQLEHDLAQRIGAEGFESKVALGGWLGLLALLLLVVGTWISMADERKGTQAAKAQTEALLGSIPVRPAPPAGGTAPEPDAEVVADDAVPDSTEPSDPPTGEPA